MSRRALTTLIACGLSSGAAHMPPTSMPRAERLDMGSISLPNAGPRWEGFYVRRHAGRPEIIGPVGIPILVAQLPLEIITDQPYSVSLPTTGGIARRGNGIRQTVRTACRRAWPIDDAALFGSKSTYSGAGSFTSVYAGISDRLLYLEFLAGIGFLRHVPRSRRICSQFRLDGLRHRPALLSEARPSRTQ